MIKVITGIRRCGKSYLLFEIYHHYLNSVGVDDSHIIELALDDDLNIRYRTPLELGNAIRVGEAVVHCHKRADRLTRLYNSSFQ